MGEIDAASDSSTRAGKPTLRTCTRCGGEALKLCASNKFCLPCWREEVLRTLGSTVESDESSDG
jgi:hypothetical protein